MRRLWSFQMHITNINAKSRPFTLLELLISLTLILSIGAVISVNGYRLLRQQRFFSSVDAVADQLNLAQQLMQVNGMDVYIRFRQEEKQQWELMMSTDRPLPPSMAIAIPAKLQLREIDEIYFLDQGDKSATQELDLYFLHLKEELPSSSIALTSSLGEKRFIRLQPLLQRPKILNRPPLPQEERDLERWNPLLFPEELRATTSS